MINLTGKNNAGGWDLKEVQQIFGLFYILRWLTIQELQ